MEKINKIIAIQGDSLGSINTKTDTTLLLALEAQKRNYKIYYYQTKNLTFSNNKVYAFCREIKFNRNLIHFQIIYYIHFIHVPCIVLSYKSKIRLLIHRRYVLFFSFSC